MGTIDRLPAPRGLLSDQGLLSDRGSLSELSDEALMAAYVAGDAAAHRVIFERLAPSLLALARQRLRDEAEAEDVVQRTFLQLHRCREDFRPDAKLRPWLFTIALNLVRDSFRRRKRRRTSPLDFELKLEALHADAQQTSECERRLEAQQVREALSRLPEDQRRAIEMHWLEERPFAEIAQQLGASVGAVKVRAHRGYKKLRTLLQAQAPQGAYC